MAERPRQVLIIVDPAWFIGSDYEQKNLQRVVQRFLAGENITADFGPAESAAHSIGGRRAGHEKVEGCRLRYIGSVCEIIRGVAAGLRCLPASTREQVAHVAFARITLSSLID